MNAPLCWTFRETAENLRIGDDVLRRLIREEGLPVIELGERVRIIPVFALEEWLRARIQSGGVPWQQQNGTSTAPAPFINAKTDAGKPSSPTPREAANASGSTARRGGRQNRK